MQEQEQGNECGKGKGGVGGREEKGKKKDKNEEEKWRCTDLRIKAIPSNHPVDYYSALFAQVDEGKRLSVPLTQICIHPAPT